MAKKEDTQADLKARRRTRRMLYDPRALSSNLGGLSALRDGHAESLASAMGMEADRSVSEPKYDTLLKKLTAGGLAALLTGGATYAATDSPKASLAAALIGGTYLGNKAGAAWHDQENLTEHMRIADAYKYFDPDDLTPSARERRPWYREDTAHAVGRARGAIDATLSHTNDHNSDRSLERLERQLTDDKGSNSKRLLKQLRTGTDRELEFYANQL